MTTGYYFVLLIAHLCIISGMQELDMCAIFQKEVTEKSLELVTPGYLENEGYSNASFCQCELAALRSDSRFGSLNVTILDLQLEVCSNENTEWDTLKVRATYPFEILHREFTLCGDKLPLSTLFRLTNQEGRRYGEENTIHSMGAMRLQFKTDKDREYRGVKLRINSYTGIRIQCSGVSGPIYTTTTPPSTTKPPTTTMYVDDSNGLRDEQIAARQATITMAAIIGTLGVLFAGGLAILVIVLIRKHRAKEAAAAKPLPSNGTRRESDGRPIYRDPGQGRPDLPMPDSAQAACEDEYLYMKGGGTTPIYENPHANGGQITYVNENSNGGSTVVEEQYQDGYIIPGTVVNGAAANDSATSREKAPLVKGLVLTENKPPVPEPKQSKNRPLPPPKGDRKLQGTDSNMSSSSDDLLIPPTGSPMPVKRHNLEPVVDSLPTSTTSQPVDKTNDSIYEPPLVKPSDLKNKAKFDIKSPAVLIKPKLAVKFNNNLAAATAPKPVVALKPNLRNKGQLPPPPPPNKPNRPAAGAKYSQSAQDTFDVVAVETSIS